MTLAFARSLLMLACACVGIPSQADVASKRAIYDPIDGKPQRADEEVHKLFGTLYNVVDIQISKHAWKHPRPKSHAIDPAMKDGVCIAGSAFAFYVINDKGTVENVRVLPSTKPDLVPFAEARFSKMVYDPPELDGHMVGTPVAGKTVFVCPSN